MEQVAIERNQLVCWKGVGNLCMLTEFGFELDAVLAEYVVVLDVEFIVAELAALAVVEHEELVHMVETVALSDITAARKWT